MVFFGLSFSFLNGGHPYFTKHQSSCACQQTVLCLPQLRVFPRKGKQQATLNTVIYNRRAIVGLHHAENANDINANMTV